jgi:hypothetical protein
MPMGNIITVVAVFEIHMDINAVATTKPRMRFTTFAPIKLIIFRMIRLYKFYFSMAMAMAMINPPHIEETYLCAKEAVVSDSSKPPVNGNKIIGNKAVTVE